MKKIKRKHYEKLVHVTRYKLLKLVLPYRKIHKRIGMSG